MVVSNMDNPRDLLFKGNEKMSQDDKYNAFDEKTAAHQAESPPTLINNNDLNGLLQSDMSDMSLGELRLLINRKRILLRLKNCDKLNKKLTVPPDYALKNPLRKLNTFCSLKDIECLANRHGKPKDAVIVISSGRADEFTVSFCENCLFDLYLVLEKAYINLKLKNFSQGSFSVSCVKTDEHCFFTGKTENEMYELKLNTASVILCRESLEMLFKIVVLSDVFCEIYHEYALKYQKHFEQKAQEKTRLEVKEECEAQIIQSQAIIDNLYKIIRNINQELQNTKIKKSGDFAPILSRQKGELADAYREKVLNCLKGSDVVNLGVSEKKARKNKITEIKVTYVNGLTCSTFDHYPRYDFVALIETQRDNDRFCFALCWRCVDIAIIGIKAYLENAENYVNEAENLSLIKINPSQNSHCYFCGGKENLVRVSFGNVQFELCEDCLAVFQAKLEEVKEKLLLIAKSGIESVPNIEFIDLS